MQNIGSQNQQSIKETFRRFDDIYRMFLLVVTITISIGSISYNSALKIDLWSGLGFILLSLVTWMIGHAIGEGDNRQFSLLLKMYAWISVSLVAFTTFLKFWLNTSTLGSSLVLMSVVFSLIATLLPFLWLSKTLSQSAKLNIAILVFIGFVGLFFGWAMTGNLIL